jgi:predicted HTH transcriptional regulator
MTDIDGLERLNLTNESVSIEAKRAGEIDKSVMETINAFSNEPNLGGGYLLLGVEKNKIPEILLLQPYSMKPIWRRPKNPAFALCAR